MRTYFVGFQILRESKDCQEYSCKTLIASKHNLQIDRKYGCNYMLPNIKENIGFELFINGVYEEEIINFIMDRLPKIGILIDIGANLRSYNHTDYEKYGLIVVLVQVRNN